MKFALITNSRIPSLTANSIQVFKVAQALMQLGYDVRIFAPAEAAPLAHAELLAHYGVRLAPPITLLPCKRPLRRFDFVYLAQQAAEQFGADLIYTWLPQSAVWALVRKSRVVLEMHGDVTGQMGAWWLRWFWKLKGERRMTVTNRTLKKVLERSTGFEFDPRAVIIAPNGVELEKYQHGLDPEAARRQLNLKENITVGFTGHIYPGRGAELLFALAQHLPGVNFLWVGGTPELVAYWHAKIKEAQMNNVTMTGFVQHAQIPLYQAAADILLMPYSRSISASSGQDIAEVINPMKMFEYMAAGRAIVTADLPVIHEILDESSAVFCPPDDLPAWLAALNSLAADPDRRAALAAQAARRSAQYTWAARVQNILKDFA